MYDLSQDQGGGGRSLDRWEIFNFAFLLGTVCPEVAAEGELGPYYACIGPFGKVGLRAPCGANGYF